MDPLTPTHLLYGRRVTSLPYESVRMFKINYSCYNCLDHVYLKESQRLGQYGVVVHPCVNSIITCINRLITAPSIPIYMPATYLRFHYKQLNKKTRAYMSIGLTMTNSFIEYTYRIYSYCTVQNCDGEKYR